MPTETRRMRQLKNNEGEIEKTECVMPSYRLAFPLLLRQKKAVLQRPHDSIEAGRRQWEMPDMLPEVGLRAVVAWYRKQ